MDMKEEDILVIFHLSSHFHVDSSLSLGAVVIYENYDYIRIINMSIGCIISYLEKVN